MVTNVEITELPEPSESGIPIIDVAVRGALTSERYDFLEKELRKLIARHGVIRVLLFPENLEGMTPDAMQEDQQFEARHIADIDRVAVVYATPEDSRVPPSAVPFTDVHTRFFPNGDTSRALEWLRSE